MTTIMQTSRRVLALALVFLAAGCIPVWTLVDANSRIAENDAFSVEMPTGWMWARYRGQRYDVLRDGRYQPLYVDRVWITRDGGNLEFIDAVRFNYEDAFPYIKKEYKAGMLPSEAAELYIANLKNAGLDNMTVVQNTPKRIAGRNGFELHIQYKNGKGLQFERIADAFGDKTGFYVVTYQAPNLYYYPLYRDTYYRVVASLKIKSGARPGKS